MPACASTRAPAVRERPMRPGRALPMRLLAASTRATLGRHVERALRRHYGAASNLRQAVRRAVLEMVTRGASDEAIRTLLKLSVEDHPERHRLDRVSIVTGKTASSVLTRQRLQWAEEPTLPRPRETRQRSSPTRGGAGTADDASR